MTIAEANAANEVAREVIALAGDGAVISLALEHGIALLLINANKTLKCGYGAESFLRGLANTRKIPRSVQSLAPGGRPPRRRGQKLMRIKLGAQEIFVDLEACDEADRCAEDHSCRIHKLRWFLFKIGALTAQTDEETSAQSGHAGSCQDGGER